VHRIVPLLLAGLLTGCAHLGPDLIPVGEATAGDLSRVALLREDSNHPVIVRGVDGIALDSVRIPSPITDYAYVLTPGRHTLWVKGAPYPHPLVPQRIYCYSIEITLEKGGQYVLVEERDNDRALALDERTRAIVAVGPLVDKPWVFERDCRWR
jgi:hypothetical protein